MADISGERTIVGGEVEAGLRSAVAILTPDEQAAVVYAENYYAAEAIAISGKLIETIGIDGVEAENVVSGLAERIRKLDFVDKKEASEHLSELLTLFGKPAVRDEIRVIHGEVTNLAAVPAHPEASTGGKEDTQTETIPLVAKDALAKFFGREFQATIGELTVSQATGIVKELADMYFRLKPPRVDEDGQVERIKHLKELINGRSIKEISADSGVTPQAINFRVDSIATNLRKKFSEEQLSAVLQRHKV